MSHSILSALGIITVFPRPGATPLRHAVGAVCIVLRLQQACQVVAMAMSVTN